MAAPVKPQKVTANGKDTWWFAPAVADMTAPTAAEINAVSGLNITCFLLAEQDGVTGTAEKVRLARLLCETSTTEGLGERSWSLADLMGVFDPQAASGDDSKKAFELFRESQAGYLIRRQGVVSGADADVTAGQFVDVFKVEVAEATPGKTSTGTDGIYSFMAPVALLDKEFNVAVAAGA